MHGTRHARNGDTIKSSGEIVNVGDAYDVFNQMLTAEYTPLLELKPLPGDFTLREDIVGPGSASVVDGEVELDGTAGLTTSYTRSYGRYISGIVAVAGVRVRVADVNSGTYRFGYGNASGNRAAIELIDGTYKTYIESGGVRWYEKERSEWIDPLDGTGPSGITHNNIDGATLRIKFAHYGGLSFRFYLAIADRTRGDREVMIDATGPREGEISLEQPDLPIFVETDSLAYIGGRQFGVYGRYRPQFRVTSSGRVTKSGVGSTNLRPIVSLRVKDDVAFVSVPASLADAKVAGNANGEYRLIIDGTLTSGGAALVDADWGNIPGIDPSLTALEMNTNADAISGGYKADSDIVTGGQGGQQGTPTEDLPDINIPRNSVITLAVIADSGTNSTFRGVLKIQEEW